ncbi:MAG: class I SAM-dependent methyltransferase [Prochlorococcus marinus subsp. pastoris]
MYLIKKKIILKLANFLSLFWLWIPSRFRRFLFTSFFILESRTEKTNIGLINLFKIKDKLEWIINEKSIVYDHGIHPKHRLTSYHKFFIDRVNEGDLILDVGCGQAIVGCSIATARNKSFVIGIDINKKNIIKGNALIKKKELKNIKLIYGDIYNQKEIKVDKVIISNVLEHINDRRDFIENLRNITGAKSFLIRVPLFERDWQLPLRKELGINYFSDIDHKIEHTIDEFKDEMKKSKLTLKEISTLYGEIWANCINE